MRYSTHWVLAAITRHPLCKLVLNVLSQYELQPEHTGEIFQGHYPGAQMYEVRATGEPQWQGTATRIKVHQDTRQ
jgi:hypothetical protein